MLECVEGDGGQNVLEDVEGDGGKMCLNMWKGLGDDVLEMGGDVLAKCGRGWEAFPGPTNRHTDGETRLTSTRV